MASRASFVRVGLLLLVGTAVLIGMVLFLAGGRLRNGHMYESYFRESVQGLTVGSPVKYRGVTMGEVTDMGLTGVEYGTTAASANTNNQYQTVYVRYRIDTAKLGEVPDTSAAVKAGLRARLASAGLTGLVYLELDFLPDPPAPRSPPWTPKAEFIPAVPSTLSQVQDAATNIASRLSKLDIEALLNNLIGLTGDLREQVDSGDLKQILTTTKTQLQHADIAGAVTALRDTTKSVQAMLEGPELKAAVKNADLTSQRLAEATAKLPALISALQATVQRTDGRTADIVAQLAPILRDTQATVANLRDTSEQLRRDPGQVLFGAPPPRTDGAR